MAAAFPPINLDPLATPNIKAMQTRIGSLEDDIRRYKQAQGNGANSSTSTLALLSAKVQQLQILADQLSTTTADLSTTTKNLSKTTADLSTTTDNLTKTTADLKTVTDLLSSFAEVAYDEWSLNAGYTLGATGWAASRVSVNITSTTGRLEIGYGGSVNSGNATFVYNVVGATSGTIYARDTVRANYARRVAVSGGASFIQSGFNTVVVTVPKGERVTVTNQMYSESSTTYFFGAKIQARVAP